MSITIRQGQCDRCKIAWTWTTNTALRVQVCANCGGALVRVSYAKIEADSYTWFAREGYGA